MKKILLIVALVLCIFQMVVLATAIDIGSPAIDRTNWYGEYMTFIEMGNPANETGKITSVEIYAYSAMSGVKVAIFYRPDPDNYPAYFTARNNETIGNVALGYNQFEVNLDVVVGDFIVLYWTAGGIEKDSSGGSGAYFKVGDQTGCSNTEFTLEPNCVLSLYGTGTTEVGWPHKWNTLTIGKWDTKEIVKWNDLE